MGGKLITRDEWLAQGRWDGHMHVDMGAGKPCNYTGYGLFNLCPVKVMDGNKELRSFAFDESLKV